MSIDDSSFGDVIDHHLGASIKLSGDGQISFVDDHELLSFFCRRVARFVQILISVALLYNHADRNVSQNVIFTIFKVANFPETWDKENSDFIIIVVRNVLYQITAEAHVILQQ